MAGNVGGGTSLKSPLRALMHPQYNHREVARGGPLEDV